jgi:O-antigen/teichoic acid export membrane protein
MEPVATEAAAVTDSLRPAAGLARGSSIALVARLAGVTISVLTSIVTSRMLGPEGKGILAFLSATSSLVVRMGSLGLDGSFTHFYLARRHRLAECVGAVLWLTIGAGGGAAIACVVLLGVFRSFAAAAPIGLAVPFFAVTPAFFVLYVSTFIFFATGQELFFGLFDVAYRGTMLLLVSIVLLGLHGGVARAVWVQIVVSVTFATIAVSAIGRSVKWDLPFRVELVRQMFAYGGRFYLYSTLRYALCYGGVMLSAILLTPRDAGLFSVALMLGEGMFLFAGAINLAFYPSVAVANEPAKYTRRAALHMLWLCAVLGSAVGLFGKLAVPLLLGRAFAPAVPAFFFMLPGLVLLGVEQLLSSYFAATRMNWNVVASMASGVAIGCTLAVASSGVWGVYGVALATGVGQLVAALGVIASFAKEARKVNSTRPD